jgi:hypothetical protein
MFDARTIDPCPQLSQDRFGRRILDFFDLVSTPLKVSFVPVQYLGYNPKCSAVSDSTRAKAVEACDLLLHQVHAFVRA